MHSNKVKAGQSVDLGFNVTVMTSGSDPRPRRNAMQDSDSYKGWTVLDKAPSGVLSSNEDRCHPGSGIWEHGSGHWWLMKQVDGEMRFAICHARNMELSEMPSNVWSSETLENEQMELSAA